MPSRSVGAAASTPRRGARRGLFKVLFYYSIFSMNGIFAWQNVSNPIRQNKTNYTTYVDHLYPQKRDIFVTNTWF